MLCDRDRLLTTFLDLVRIDNPSGEEAEIAAHIRGLCEAMGLVVEEDVVHNVLVRVPGVGEPLLFNAHMDSVSPCRGVRPIVVDGVVRSSGDTVLGADDLAGVAAILEGVRVARARVQPHRAAEILFTVQEEVGLRGAAAFDMGRLQARQGFTFDSGGDFGGITLGAPSQDSLHVTVFGRAAHAGLVPEHGINAIVVAAQALGRMPLGRIDAETTANIGVIKGGEATNIVPAQVELWGEARSHDAAKLAAQVQVMRGAFEQAAHDAQAGVQIEVSHKYDAYRFSEELPVVQQVVLALRAMGVVPQFQISGGGSDVNVFAHHGLCVVNLSVGYRAIHSTDEHIAIADMMQAAELVTRLLDVA